MRSPSGLQACGHLALARGQGAPFCHRRCSMCSRAGTDAAVPTSSATSAPLAELAAPCSRPGHCQGVLAPRAAHARGRGGSTKRRRLLQACPTRYTGTRVKCDAMCMDAYETWTTKRSWKTSLKTIR